MVNNNAQISCGIQALYWYQRPKLWQEDKPPLAAYPTTSSLDRGQRGGLGRSVHAAADTQFWLKYLHETSSEQAKLFPVFSVSLCPPQPQISGLG